MNKQTNKNNDKRSREVVTVHIWRVGHSFIAWLHDFVLACFNHRPRMALSEHCLSSVVSLCSLGTSQPGQQLPAPFFTFSHITSLYSIQQANDIDTIYIIAYYRPGNWSKRGLSNLPNTIPLAVNHCSYRVRGCGELPCYFFQAYQTETTFVQVQCCCSANVH